MVRCFLCLVEREMAAGDDDAFYASILEAELGSSGSVSVSNFSSALGLALLIGVSGVEGFSRKPLTKVRTDIHRMAEHVDGCPQMQLIGGVSSFLQSFLLFFISSTFLPAPLLDIL
jgi:hypothetical protein